LAHGAAGLGAAAFRAVRLRAPVRLPGRRFRRRRRSGGGVTVRRLLLILAVALAGAGPAAGQEKVSSYPIAEPHKAKRIFPASTQAVDPKRVPYEGLGGAGAQDAGYQAYGPEAYGPEAYGPEAYGPEAYWDYPVPLDSAALAPKPAPRDALQRFRDDPAYAYAEAGPRARGPTLWERFRAWIT